MTSSIRARAQEDRKDVLKVWAPLVLLVVVGFAIAYSRLDPPPPKDLVIAAGAEGGAYFKFAHRYREILARQGFELEVRATAGSIENLALLRSGEVDLALVQGGTAGEEAVGPRASLVTAGDAPGDEEPAADDDGAPRLEALASLFFEPLWVFHRSELEIDHLRQLEGLRLAVGAEGSGTRPLVLQLLALNGIDEGNTTLLPLGSRAAAAALAEGMADAAFLVSAGSSPMVEELLRRPELALLGFRRHLAYVNRLPFLSTVVLGEGAVDLDANLPPDETIQVAAAASLAARSDLHHALIPLLLAMVLEVHGRDAFYAESAIFPSAQLTELPINREAEQYLEKGPSFLYSFLPFRTAAAVDRLKILLLPLITLLIPVFRVAPPIYRWRIRSRIYRWYEDLKLVDTVLQHEPSQEEIEEHLEMLRELQQEVTEVQVPLSYMDEFYRLRGHIQLILGQLERLAGGIEGDRG